MEFLTKHSFANVFKTLKMEFLTKHSFANVFFQNGENFPPKKSLIELCLYARPTYSPRLEHYMLKLAWTL
jgi:hypothetical protein